MLLSSLSAPDLEGMFEKCSCLGVTVPDDSSSSALSCF